MYTRPDALLLGDARYQFAVADIAFLKGSCTWHRVAMAARQIVKDRDAFAALDQQFNRHCSDIARATCHQDTHFGFFAGQKHLWVAAASAQTAPHHLKAIPAADAIVLRHCLPSGSRLRPIKASSPAGNFKQTGKLPNEPYRFNFQERSRSTARSRTIA